ncbi:MAG: DUF1853 family protein [Burkholderiaceae bacterium]
MQAPADTKAPAVQESSQQRFHRCWGDLRDPHLRALAWLLDSSDLLDAQAGCWHGKIATLCPNMAATGDWLRAEDTSPERLHAALNLPGVSRLGKYAERLLAHYFTWCGTLVAHNLQIQVAGKDTIGEFDFLLQEGTALIHYELATKFYLFESPSGSNSVEHLVGPNLADTLDAKMRKILGRQLALGMHPAAQAYLPRPIDRAQAMVKGWLFYRNQIPGMTVAPGVAPGHCRGFWCSLGEFGDLTGNAFALLPRLAWLAPARVGADTVYDHGGMEAILHTHFAVHATPVMVAHVRRDGSVAREEMRGFVVPDDWRTKVRERRQPATSGGAA